MEEVVCRDWPDFETMEPCEQAVGTEGYVVWKASVAELWYGQHVAELAISVLLDPSAFVLFSRTGHRGGQRCVLPCVDSWPHLDGARNHRADADALWPFGINDRLRAMYFYSLLSVQHPQTESGSDAPMQERFRGLEQAETNKSLRDFDPTCMLATVCPYCAAVCMSDPQLLNDLQKRSDLSDASWVEIRRSSQVGWLLSVLGFEGRKYKHKRDTSEASDAFIDTYRLFKMHVASRAKGIYCRLQRGI